MASYLFSFCRQKHNIKETIESFKENYSKRIIRIVFHFFKMIFGILIVFSFSACAALRIEPRIVKGFPSEQLQFPYFAFLETDTENGTYTCGGSLINEEWILTAAHCLTRAHEIRAHLGSWKIHDVDEVGREIYLVTKKNFHPHPNFSLARIANDIGLIRLPQPTRFNQRIQKIQLPTKCESNENVDVVSMGNGMMNMSITDQLAPVLQWSPFKTLSNEKCLEAFPLLKYRTTAICVQNKDMRSVCHGDSGGGLVRRTDTTLIGVTSFISITEGCEKGFPQVFTNVIPYHQWISKITGLDLIRC